MASSRLFQYAQNINLMVILSAFSTLYRFDVLFYTRVANVKVVCFTKLINSVVFPSSSDLNKDSVDGAQATSAQATLLRVEFDQGFEVK